MVLVKELLQNIEDVYAKLQQAEVEQKLIKKDLRTLRKERRENSVQQASCLDAELKAWLEKECQIIEDRRFDLVEKLYTLQKTTDVLRTRICEHCDMLFNTLEANIYPFEMLKMLERRTEANWNVRWIKSWDGVNVGAAFVREDDEFFDKTIYADTSLIDMSVEIENSDSRKVIFTSLVLPSDAVYINWNWLEYYVYSKTGFFFNEVMQQLFNEFNERDSDFAEFIVDEISKEVQRTELSEFIKTEKISSPESV